MEGLPQGHPQHNTNDRSLRKKNGHFVAEKVINVVIHCTRFKKYFFEIVDIFEN